ncbi:MAG: beta-galactosidase [Anaerolineae bacterium]|jgi:hypothetical protein|nr:beta-galactosidase [Anaerolineae bacterium]
MIARLRGPAGRALAGRLWRGRGWAARLLLLLWLLSLIHPAPPRAMLEDPQTVSTMQPLLCVHTRFTDEVHEWIIQRSMQLVREMGADTIVEFFPWAYFEPQPGAYRWERVDLVMRHARNQGLKVLARMGFVPEWARPPGTTFNDLPESSYPAFARFVAAFAARYPDVVPGVILWNEPNLAFEWGFRPVDAAAYTRLLQVVYPAVQAASPTTLVLAGALAPTLEPPGSPAGLNDLLYLEAMYQAGAAPYFDALAVHTYGFTQPPAADPAPDVLNFRRVELLHDVLRRYDDPAKPVYITESGWNDHPRWTKAVRPSQRVQYTVDSYRLAAARWPWLEKLCLWAFRYPRFTYSYPDNFMIVSVGFERTPLYEALRALSRGTVLETQLWLPAPAPAAGR